MINRETELDCRKDHFERRQVAAQVIDAKDRVADFVKQRFPLIRPDQNTISIYF